MQKVQLDRQSVYNAIADAQARGYMSTLSSDPQEMAGGTIAMSLSAIGLALMYLADKIDGNQTPVLSAPMPVSQPSPMPVDGATWDNGQQLVSVKIQVQDDGF